MQKGPQRSWGLTEECLSFCEPHPSCGQELGKRCDLSNQMTSEILTVLWLHGLSSQCAHNTPDFDIILTMKSQHDCSRLQLEKWLMVGLLHGRTVLILGKPGQTSEPDALCKPARLILPSTFQQEAAFPDLDPAPSQQQGRELCWRGGHPKSWRPGGARCACK